MPKPPRIDIMVSSTLRDLKDHRDAARDAILQAGMFPLRMEEAGAQTGTNAVRFSRDLVRDADVYVGLFAYHYGYIPDDEDVSVTEIEYRAWSERQTKDGMLGFLFLQDPDHPLPRSAYDDKNIEKIEALRNEMQGRHVVAFFTTPEDLRGKVQQALESHREEIEERLTVGPPEREKVEAQERDKSSIPSPPEMYSAPAYVPGYEFVGRREELAKLDRWAVSDKLLLVVEAIGGMGKSALTWQWAKTRAREVVPEAAGIFWYSFYEGGARLASCFQHALAYLSDRPPEDFRGRKAPDLAEELLAELRRKPYLLVLDGLERVLVAYHRLDASQIRDDQVDSDLRSCIDPADTEILRRLVSCVPSRLLISTRLFPRALENKSRQPLPGVVHEDLRGLNEEDAAIFMDQAGIFGDLDDLLRFMAQFEHHPLVLGVVAGLINDYPRDPGNFDRWHVDPEAGGQLKLSKLDLVQRRTHILHYALAGLDPNVRQVLCRAAAFAEAVDYETLVVINPFLPNLSDHLGDSRELEWMRSILGETALRRSLEGNPKYHESWRKYLASLDYRNAVTAFDNSLWELQQRGLLQFDRTKRVYDLHPVVRGFALDLLDGEDRFNTFSTLADHFQSRAPDRYEEVSDLADLENSLTIFRALVGAGKLDKAVNFYAGGFDQSLLYSCEAYPTVIEILTPFFTHGLEELPALGSARDQGFVANQLALALGESGRSEEALKMAALSVGLDLEVRDAANLHTGFFNYCIRLPQLNRLAACERGLRLALRLAETLGGFALTRAHFNLMVRATRAGSWDEAEHFARAFLKGEPPPRYVLRPGDFECLQCWMLLARGMLAEPELNEAFRIASDAKSREVIRRLHEVRGEWGLERGRPQEAEEAIRDAIILAQKAGVPVGGLRARLALARARLGEHQAAVDLLGECGDDTEDWGLAEAWLALGEREKATQHGFRGYERAWADGPPHVWWRELQRMKKLLAELDVDPPELPPFDPDAVEPLPCEEKIVAFIEEREAKRKRKPG